MGEMNLGGGGQRGGIGGDGVSDPKLCCVLALVWMGFGAQVPAAAQPASPIPTPSAAPPDRPPIDVQRIRSARPVLPVGSTCWLAQGKKVHIFHSVFSVFSFFPSHFSLQFVFFLGFVCIYFLFLRHFIFIVLIL